MNKLSLCSVLAIGLVLLVSSGRVSRAQPSASPPPARAVDSPDVTAAYEDGFRALLEGDLASAIAGLEIAAAQSTVAARRAAAAELLRLARTLSERGAVYLTRNMEPDRRFRMNATKPTARQVQVMPTVIKGSPGLSVGGAF